VPLATVLLNWSLKQLRGYVCVCVCVCGISPDSSVAAGTNSTTADHKNCDTVGAVAVDACGNFAYATSTGGITAKQLGRVGDSPIVGRYQN